MRESILIGLLCTLFALGAYRGTGEWGVFGVLNLGLGVSALALAVLLGLRRAAARRAGAPPGVIGEAVLRLVAVVWAAVLLQQAAAASGVRFDWTLERRYELAPATRAALERMPGRVFATLYADRDDPRRRRTRLLLDQLARRGDVVVRERALGDAPEEEDLFGIASSNSVVFELGDRWERVDRPTEGPIFEALSYLAVTQPRVVYVNTGAGEGDLASTEDSGFSGLGAALETEGVQVRMLVGGGIDAIPDDAEAVLSIAPRRRLHPRTLAALRAFVERGGHWVVMIEPGVTSGVEEILADYGLRSPDAVVVDPSSGSVHGETPGLDPIVFNYSSDNSVTRGLDPNRHVYFRGARSFVLRKPRPEDRLHGVVFSSRESWLDTDTSVLERGRTPERPPGVRTDYHPIVVTGVYPHADGSSRIVAIGDSDFANNANLRSLYNLDLAMNAVHWALRDEPMIRIRPKAGSLIQFPVPIQNSLKAFYGVGLVVPELLLLAGGLVWLRRRTA